jgi:predicted membrane channel-forming protein YqfA (hemolysin III family)
MQEPFILAPVKEKEKAQGEQGKFSRGEELANALSHLAGALLGIAALVLMVVYSARVGTA